MKKNTQTLKFGELSRKREGYKNLTWLSTSGKSTKIVQMEDDYLLNVLRKCHEKLQLSNSYPFIEEFKSWNNICYKTYTECLSNEYQWRQVNIDNEYTEYLNYQILEQDYKDRFYYDDKYGDCF